MILKEIVVLKGCEIRLDLISQLGDLMLQRLLNPHTNILQHLIHDVSLDRFVLLHH